MRIRALIVACAMALLAPAVPGEAQEGHPLVGVGASLAAGLVVGLAFGGGSKRRRKRQAGYADDGRQIVVVASEAQSSGQGIVRDDTFLSVGFRYVF